MVDEKRIVRRKLQGDPAVLFPDVPHPVLQRVYAARAAAGSALDLSLARMIPVSQLTGVAEAAERLAAAHVAGERILVLGDFDVDGATATALMVTCLKAYGYAAVEFMVPDRQKYGYGLSPGIVAVAAERSPDIIITVDNGISSHAGIAAAAAHGIDVVVTDHHLPGETLPDAAVIVNPNAPDNDFPSKALAGVGVAFYVMAALGQRLAADGMVTAADARSICANCLDLVALGTVADLVPLDQNNRVLVAQGMARMRAGQTRPGITELFAAAGRNIAEAVTSDLAFAVAPRLNAAGRLTDMTVGINCLLAESNAAAAALARELSQLNEQRRAMQADMQDVANLHLDKLETGNGETLREALCLYDPDWHQGVVGLVATRVRERVNRPVVAFAPGESAAMLKGSGRSVAGVHLRDILAHIDACNPGLIERYGGHAMAAGLTLSMSNLEAFRAAFAAEVERHAHAIDETEALLSEGAVTADELNLELAQTLRHAAPWGQAFPEPLFDGAFEVLEQRIVGERHLKLKVQPVGSKQAIEGIAFNRGELLPAEAGRVVTLLYRLDVNEFRSVRTAQLVVEHIESE